MPRLPRLRGRELLKIFLGMGFEVIRIKGSHHYIRHPDGRRTTIPIHAGETIGPGLVHQILKDVELDVQDLERKK